MIDAQAQRAVERVSTEARELFGADLVSLILYGSAAGQDFVPDQSDVNIAIVLNRVDTTQLRKLHGRLRDWRVLRIAVPLLIDREFLRRACDVFPMELFDIQGQHRILFGEDVIAPLRIEARYLRYQAEHEARSKLLRLRAIYAEVGDDLPRLRALLCDSVKTFALLMRNLLHLRTGEHLISSDEAMRRFEEVFGRQFPALHQVQLLKRQVAAWPGDVHDLFAAYVDDVEALVRLVDRLPVENA